MESGSSKRTDPQPLGDILSHLFALRGYGRVQGNRQIQEIWREVAGESIAQQTRVMGVRNGVLQVGVFHSALLSELAAFHQWSLLERLQADHRPLGITKIKFRLQGQTD